MKVVKCLICMLLSLVVLTIGIGFAQLTDEITATGELNYTHTSLYISSVTPNTGVTVTGYSGTLINLTSEAGKSITLTVTNPTSDEYYFLNYTSSLHSISISESELPLGKAVPASYGSITFTVTFTEAKDYSVKFNFTLIPPEIDVGGDEGGEGEDDGFTSSTNATAVIDFTVNHMSYGLNADINKNGFLYWCTSSNRILFCRKKSVSGANLNNEFATLGASNIYYTLEWVSETKYNLYLYYTAEADANRGKYITVYKQEIIYNSVIGEWAPADSYKGYAKAVTFDKEINQIELAEGSNGNDYVVWYSSKNDLPTDAEIVV